MDATVCVGEAVTPNCHTLALSYLAAARAAGRGKAPFTIFNARRRAPPLHSACQKFGNTDYFFKLRVKATMSRFDETMGGSPVISCEGREVLQRTRVRQVFQRVVV